MRKIGLIVVSSVAALAALSLAGREAAALRAGAGGAADGACMEAFQECQRGCGPSPSTANPACLKYCEEQVLARCKAGGGAAAKGQTIAPGAVKGGVKARAQ